MVVVDLCTLVVEGSLYLLGVIDVLGEIGKSLDVIAVLHKLRILLKKLAYADELHELT